MEDKSQRLDERLERFEGALKRFLGQRGERVAELAARLPHPRRQQAFARERFAEVERRLHALFARPGAVLGAQEALRSLSRVLESVSYQATLERGFAVVRGPAGVLTRAAQVGRGDTLRLEFADGEAAATAGPGGPGGPAGPDKPKPRKGARPRNGTQGSLL